MTFSARGGRIKVNMMPRKVSDHKNKSKNKGQQQRQQRMVAKSELLCSRVRVQPDGCTAKGTTKWLGQSMKSLLALLSFKNAV